jgi:hypothetical protein
LVKARRRGGFSHEIQKKNFYRLPASVELPPGQGYRWRNQQVTGDENLPELSRQFVKPEENNWGY